LLQPQLLRSDGSVPVLEKDVRQPSEDSRLETIITQIDDPKASAAHLQRLIEGEMARAIVAIGTDHSKRSSIARLLAQVRTLKVLAAEVRQAAKLRQREDVLDLDGPKFTFVLHRSVEILQRVLQKALDESTVQSLLRQLRDEFEMEEPQIRRELKRMG